MVKQNHRRFTMLLAVVAFLWLVVFPWMASWPSIEYRSAWLKENGITPAAFMYADHAVADKTLEQLDDLNRQHGDALWVPARWRTKGTTLQP